MRCARRVLVTLFLCLSVYLWKIVASYRISHVRNEGNFLLREHAFARSLVIFATKLRRRSRSSKHTFLPIVLCKDTPGSGETGDVIDVRPGYAFNYLFPRKYARRATPADVVQFETRILWAEEASRSVILQLKQVETKLSGTILEYTRIPKSTSGHKETFVGTIGIEDIIEQLHSLRILPDGKKFKPQQIKLRSPITTFGSHVIDVMFLPGKSTPIRIRVKTE